MVAGSLEHIDLSDTLMYVIQNTVVRVNVLASSYEYGSLITAMACFACVCFCMIDLDIYTFHVGLPHCLVYRRHVFSEWSQLYAQLQDHSSGSEKIS